MKPCPNCEQPVNPGINLCPNCGADTSPLWAAPIAPGLVELEMVEFTKRMQSERRFGFGAGFAVALLLGILTLPISFVTVPLLCYFMRSHPDFAKGCRWGGRTLLILIISLFLGLLIMCSGAH